MGTNREYFIRIPICLLLGLSVTACTGSTYFVKSKNQQRYTAADIAPNIFDDDEGDNYIEWRRGATSQNGLDIENRSTRNASYRDSNVIGKLYYDPDGEGQGEKPYALTIRKSYRSYEAEAPLTEPIRIGKHDMTPHLSFGRHKDHDYMAGLRFRMPF